MTKNNISKAVICVLMLTGIIGTTVFAGTNALTQVEHGDYVYEVELYINEMRGELGYFKLQGDLDYSQLTVQNVNSQPRKFEISALAYNANNQGTILDSDYKRQILNPSSQEYISIYRDFDNPMHRYEHSGKSFYYTNTDSVYIDVYECDLYQYH